MKVLIIEDEQTLVKNLSQKLNGLDPRIETVIARSRNGGITAIQREEFDYIVCDLRIPPHDGGLDLDEDHGIAVHSMAKELCPGTPRMFFTGYATDRNVSDQLSLGGTQDVHGTGKPYPMSRLLTKEEFLRCIELLAEFNSELEALGSIRIDHLRGTRNLDKMEVRALRIWARRLGGTKVEVEELKGLSGAQTLRARVRNHAGHVVAFQFVKIAKRASLKEEQENYQRHVGPLLEMGRFPSLQNRIVAGIGKRVALFYQFADGYSDTLFDVLNESDCAATGVVESLRDILKPWMKSCEERPLNLRQFREGRIDNARLSPFLEKLGPVEALEEVEKQVSMCCQHGDLHGFNVLCNPSRRAVVIDFGNVGPAPACADPILLELSVLFHRDSPFSNKAWPTKEQAEAWFDLDEYLRGCPIPNFVKKCREWARECAGASDLPLVVYAEALRQLKYEDTDHDRAIRIARAAIREMA